MFNLGGGEILVILVVALLVLGPEKLPRFMRTVGKAVGDLRRASTDFQRTMNLELAEKETESNSKKTEPAVSPAAPEPITPAPISPEEEAAAVASVTASSSPRPKRLRAAPPRRTTRKTRL